MSSLGANNVFQEWPAERILAHRFCQIYNSLRLGPEFYHYSTSHPDPVIAQRAMALLSDEIKEYMKGEPKKALDGQEADTPKDVQ